MTSIDHSNSLTDLAERVRALQSSMIGARKAAARHAVAIGAALLEAKEAAGHGQWIPFLERTGFSERRAQRLMQIVRSGLKPDTVADLGIRRAAELAASRRPPEGDEVLFIWVGMDPEGRPGPAGEITLYLAESEKHPGYIDIAGFDALAPEVIALMKPIDKRAEAAIFEFADRCLRGRFTEMQFARLAGAELLRSFRAFRDLALEVDEP
ncbi:MAG: DUF3102 domain-containing protein [Proteobacteria bacterium]|nr:DUF3102 domain-containing protein [Pseudomonadota bacterium]